MFDKHTASQVEREGKKIIASVLEQVKKVCDSTLSKVVDDNTPTVEIANMLNEQRMLDREVKTMAMTYFEKTLKDVKHCAVDHGVKVSIDAINDSAVDGYYQPAVGKCMKCSMMYFAKVTLTREVAESILDEGYNSYHISKPKTSEYVELMSEAKNIIRGTTEEECENQNVVCSASKLLEDTEPKGSW